ncbi:MAG: bifunctional DNA-formamidopyrimidine glycosylase/DNA-(apurinic or apyrimidinic site) lyase [Patescibacteria group bacterium]|jgi:formamidopyrimidine-DNA glycosylase
MPELPEVETIRQDLQGLLGKKFVNIKILNQKTAQPSAAFLKKKIIDQKIISLTRRGKLLIFSLSNQAQLLIHLKMTGQLIYQQSRQTIYGGHSTSEVDREKAVGGPLPNQHTRVILYLNNQQRLFFNDLRKFGYLKVVDSQELEKILANNYGPEPLEAEFSVNYLSQQLEKRTIKIKPLLLNQRVIAGLGNIYVDESLFLAKIRPDRVSASLTTAEIKSLRLAIRRIIAKAIKYRGTTFSDFIDTQGRSGNFLRFLQVYGRQGQSCFCCGDIIVKVKLGGRGTHYCPTCQK